MINEKEGRYRYFCSGKNPILSRVGYYYLTIGFGVVSVVCAIFPTLFWPSSLLFSRDFLSNTLYCFVALTPSFIILYVLFTLSWAW